jgi:hypothetical protein
MNNPLNKGRLLFLTAMLFLAAFTFTASGCRLLKRDKQSMAEKKQAEVNKKASAEYEKARKQHYDHQSKDAKKMMKRTQKQATKFNQPMRRKGFNKTKCN